MLSESFSASDLWIVFKISKRLSVSDLWFHFKVYLDFVLLIDHDAFLLEEEHKNIQVLQNDEFLPGKVRSAFAVSLDGKYSPSYSILTFIWGARSTWWDLFYRCQANIARLTHQSASTSRKHVCSKLYITETLLIKPLTGTEYLRSPFCQPHTVLHEKRSKHLHGKCTTRRKTLRETRNHRNCSNVLQLRCSRPHSPIFVSDACWRFLVQYVEMLSFFTVQVWFNPSLV